MRKKLAREILDHFPDPAPVLSLYSDTDRSRRAPREIALSLKNLFRKSQDLVSGCDAFSGNGVQEVLEKFLPRFETMPQPVPPGWAYFLSPEAEPLIYPLPVSVPDHCSLGYRPRLFPLVQAVSPFRETLVVVLEGHEVRFFRKLGERMELVEARPEEVPSRIRAGGRYGMDERRIERHAREELERTLGDIAETVRGYFEAHAFDRLLVAGSKEQVPRLVDQLRHLLPSVECDRVPDGTGPDADLRSRMTSWAMGRFWEEGESLVDRIRTESSKEGLAASGWRGTLAASNARAVHTLVLEEYDRVGGMRCPACGSLGLDERVCPVCGEAMEPEEDLMEGLLQRTIRQDGDALVLGRPSSLREEEGLGAILRFTF